MGNGKLLERINSLSFVGHKVSVKSTLAYYCSPQAAKDSEQGYVSIIFYMQQAGSCSYSRASESPLRLLKAQIVRPHL